MTLALIAGRGRLPGLILSALEARGDPVLVARLADDPPDFACDDAVIFRLETLGTLIKTLLERGVTRACFAGAVRRPLIDPARIDAATLPLVPRLMSALEQGDDGALRTVLALFEAAGIEIVAATDLVPDLLADDGVLTRATPSDRSRQDATRAAGILAAMAPADIGQGVVVARGQALAIEAQAGTDWMLRSLALMAGADDVSELPATKGGLLFKAPKLGQDWRIDLPAIGPDTVALAASLGLAGIVTEARGIVMLERDLLLRMADDAGIFVWSRAPE
ncbi:LpxI family protein [Oceaniovalibus sp. ACAM 378]|uniref:LpxI family protein n=1 Tax=Oceaniovalibus sp. ACAM 378 TaxID=2599923 RepID=UPI0011DAB840|nr:UDP-2,3-diacylglucosamine diphosphatase LpxI [Oceaniovalibus sp. ACAM 378]TYB89688.1 LpxI family protein [Oceaniovalibus sp. ACAM 378]